MKKKKEQLRIIVPSIDIVIVGATVLLTRGTDKVLLKTNLPCPYTPAGVTEQPPLDLSFDATRGTGVDYCRTVLFLEPKVINTL